jgi:hypothetical protein
MSTFLLKYRSGASEYVQTDATSVADQINRTFGLSEEEAADFGVAVEMMPDDFEFVPGMIPPPEAEAEAEPEPSAPPPPAPPAPPAPPLAEAKIEGHAPTIGQTTDAPQKSPWEQ